MSRPKFTSTLIEPPIFSIRLNTHKLPTTSKMVEEAVLALNNRKGFSLYKLKKHISDTYQIELSQKRKNFITKELRTLLENGTLINLTGKGLTGSLRMVSKSGRSSSRLNNEKKHSVTTNEEENILIKRKKAATKARKNNENVTATPPNNSIQALLPPNAPQRNTVTELGILDKGDTPHSSGGRVGNKRMLLPTTEVLTMGSQVF